MSAEQQRTEHLLAADRAHVWHPYAAMPGEGAQLVTSAQGVWLHLADGGKLIDAMSSWWSVVHGHRHPDLDAAAVGQLGRMSHVMFGGLTHEPAIRLAGELLAVAPEGMEHVFFSDSGSVSVEVAAKMCLQYWRSSGREGKRRLATWRGGYHGDTFHPMSVCDPEGGMHALWTGVLPEQVFAPAPPQGFDAPAEQAYLDQLEEMLAEHAHELAAVIVEPVVQGAGGMRFHNPEYLRALRRLCTAHEVLLIFDEIATGFGRTGEYFAADHAGVSPDVMCVGKALTGGYLTAAATLCSAEVAAGISSGEVPVLAHGPTFMANPLACTIALASMRLLATGHWRQQVAAIEQALRHGLAPAEQLAGVREVRVLGAIGVIELERELDPEQASTAARAAQHHGVWLRPFRNLIYTMPPYICTEEQVGTIAAAATAAASAASAATAAP